MMNLKNRAILITLASLSSTAAFAQYSPTIGDLNAVWDPPMNIQGILCGIYTDVTAQSICKDGSAAARWMAEKYAKNAGAYLGCIDGMSQGLKEGYNAGKNPTAEMTAHSLAMVKGSDFRSGIERAREQAKREGQTASADQIIARYRAVINRRDSSGSQVLPNKSYEYPTITFMGYEDGYDVDVSSNDSNLTAAYNAGWVTQGDAWVDRITAGKMWALKDDYMSRACNQNDTIFGRRNMPALSFWDYFRKREQIDFQNYGWSNADWAWEVLVNNENTLDTYLTYAGIEKLTKQVSQTVIDYGTRNKLDANGKAIPKLDTQGKPVVDNQGVIQYETEKYQTGTHVETSVVALNSSEKDALRTAYLTGFKESYKRYYARQYASQNYAKVGLDKYAVGKEIGNALGKEVAARTADRNAYNAAYKTNSASAYAAEAKANYKASFDHLIDIFQNNPVLELNSISVTGQTNDGIFRPGEELGINFAATNLGEKSRVSNLSFLPSRDLTPTSSGFGVTVPALSSLAISAGVLGRVSDTIEARNQVTVSIGIQNPGDLKEVARSLVVQKDQPVMIDDYLEVAQAIPSLDYIAGTFTASVDVINPASANAPITATKVELNLGAAGSVRSNILSVPGGGTQKVALTVDSLDPLAIIDAASVSGTVRTFVGDRIAHHANLSARLPEDQLIAKLRYFDALATGRTAKTGSTSMSDRIAQLITTFNSVVRMNIGKGDGHDNVRWDDDGDVRQTLIYQIQKFYKESANAGRMNSNAKAVYNQLGRTLADNADEVRAGGFLRSAKKNRKAYLSQIKVFADI